MNWQMRPIRGLQYVGDFQFHLVNGNGIGTNSEAADMEYNYTTERYRGFAIIHKQFSGRDTGIFAFETFEAESTGLGIERHLGSLLKRQIDSTRTGEPFEETLLRSLYEHFERLKLEGPPLLVHTILPGTVELVTPLQIPQVQSR